MQLTIILIIISYNLSAFFGASNMYVCICNGVTDRDIHRALESGDRNFRQVSKSLGVASQCGSCEVLAREIIEEYKLQASAQTPFYAAM